MALPSKAASGIVDNGLLLASIAKDIVTVTQSDTTDDPAGPFGGLRVACTVAGNIKVTTIAGNARTFPVSVGTEIIPVGVKFVWSTGTTVTATIQGLVV